VRGKVEQGRRVGIYGEGHDLQGGGGRLKSV
jgi:hypothetical protein